MIGFYIGNNSILICFPMVERAGTTISSTDIKWLRRIRFLCYPNMRNKAGYIKESDHEIRGASLSISWSVNHTLQSQHAKENSLSHLDDR
jgi:hypothetical protein